MTVEQLISRALRMNGVKMTGEALTADEGQDGLLSAQLLYYDIIDKGADLTDVRISTDYTAGENERVFNTIGTNIPIDLPEYIQDTSLTPDADGNQYRPPADFSIVSLAGSPRQTHVYDATLGAWVKIEDMALTTTAPWSTQLGQGLSAMLAVVMANEYGLEAKPTTLALAADCRTRVNGKLQTGSVFLQPDRRWA